MLIGIGKDFFVYVFEGSIYGNYYYFFLRVWYGFVFGVV